MNGGMQRCFNIIHEIARRSQLTLIIHQSKADFLKCLSAYPSMANVEVHSSKDVNPKADFFKLMPGKLQNGLRYRWYKKTFKGPADGLFLSYYSILVHLMKKQRYDVVMLENLASLNAVSVIRRFDKKVKIVYDAHNVDSHLAKVAVSKWDMDEATMKRIEFEEQNLYKKIDGLIACSDDDRVEFLRINDHKFPAEVVPNGVEILNRLYDAGVNGAPAYVLFCGTLGSVPNTEGLVWFYNNCWQKVNGHFPALKLLVVGSGQAPSTLKAMQQDISVEFTGPVADTKLWYNKASIAIVPLLSGSGTRLKILEAMSMGVPVVSTSKGAEGIEYRRGESIIIADESADFSNAVISLLDSLTLRTDLKIGARRLVEEKYNWNLIGETLHTFLTNFFQQTEKKK